MNTLTQKTPAMGDIEIEIEGIAEVSPDDTKFTKIVE